MRARVVVALFEVSRERRQNPARSRPASEREDDGESDLAVAEIVPMLFPSSACLAE